jgi:hypothetical protein
MLYIQSYNEKDVISDRIIPNASKNLFITLIAQYRVTYSKKENSAADVIIASFMCDMSLR